MGHHDHPVREKTDSGEALLPVISAVIFERDRIPVEEGLDPDEVDTVLPKVRLPLRLIPFEPHLSECSYTA